MAWARLCRGLRTKGGLGVAREARAALDQESKQRRRSSAELLWRVRLEPVLGSAWGRDDQYCRRHTRPAHGASDRRALVHIPGVRLLRHPRRRAAASQTKRMTQRVAMEVSRFRHRTTATHSDTSGANYWWGSPVSIGLLIGSWLHSNQPPS